MGPKCAPVGGEPRIHTDDQGRVIVFDAGGCTWSNIYLPSGTDAQSRPLREPYSRKILPNLFVLRVAQGAACGLQCFIFFFFKKYKC